VWDRRGCGVLRRLDSFLLLFSDQAEKSREILSGNKYFGVISQHAQIGMIALDTIIALDESQRFFASPLLHNMNRKNSLIYRQNN